MIETKANPIMVVAGAAAVVFLLLVSVSAVVQHATQYTLPTSPARLAAAPAVSDPNASIAGGYITVTATGSAYGIPNQEQITVSINGTGNTALAATQSISATLKNFNATMVGYAGGNLSNIQTDYYSLYTRCNRTVYTAPPTGEGGAIIYPTSQCVGMIYVAAESITVTLPNVADASSALGALSEIQNVTVNGASSVLSQNQMNALRIQALKNALANATQQATALAGTSVVQHNITVSSYTFYPVYQTVATPAVSTAPTPIVYTGRSAMQETLTVQFSYSG